MPKGLLLVALLAAAGGTHAAAKAPPVEAAVVALAELVADATGRLDPFSVRVYGNGRAAVFTVEGAAGGPVSWQYVAFFEPNEAWPDQPPPSRPLRLVAFRRIGDRAGRMYDPDSGRLEGRSLVLSGSVPRRGDSTCCPSGRLKTVFTLTGQDIAEHTLGRSHAAPS